MTQRTENAADYQQLGEHIHALRTTKGFGLREAARLAGVDPTWLSRLEQGLYTSPNTQSLARVAQGLDVDIEEFYVVLGLTNGQGLPARALPTGQVRPARRRNRPARSPLPTT